MSNEDSRTTDGVAARFRFAFCAFALFVGASSVSGGESPQLGILTPKPGEAPRINGASVYGVRPGRPILYRLPVTGVRPMKFAASKLPRGVTFDAKSGIVSGSIAARGEHPVKFRAENAKGRFVVKKPKDSHVAPPPHIAINQVIGDESAVDDGFAVVFFRRVPFLRRYPRREFFS